MLCPALKPHQTHSFDRFDVFVEWEECYEHVLVVGLVAGLVRWPLTACFVTNRNRCLFAGLSLLPEFQLILQVLLLNSNELFRSFADAGVFRNLSLQ